MTINLANAAHVAAVSSIVRHLSGSDITFQSDKLLNEHFGGDSVAFAADIGGFELPVRFEAVVAVKNGIRHQFSISDATGDRLIDRRYVLDVKMYEGKLSAALFERWLVTSPAVVDSDVVQFFERIVEKAKVTKTDFILEAAK